MFKQLAAPFLEPLQKPRERKIILIYMVLALLFLVYIWNSKEAFLKGNGYGIPHRIAKSAASRTEQISRLQKQRSKLRHNRTRAAQLQKQIVTNRQMQQRQQRRLHRYFRYLGWFLSAFLVLFVIPALFIRWLPGYSRADFGLAVGDWRLALRIGTVFFLFMSLLVVLLIVLGEKNFLQYYPMFAKRLPPLPGEHFWVWFLLLEAGYLLYFVGWEFYFRGLLIFPLREQLGSAAALIGVLPFAVMHAGKPLPEAVGSIIAAWALGVLALRTGSFWVCALLHFMVAFLMDLGAALARGLFV